METNLKNKIAVLISIAVVAAECFSLFFNFSSAQAILQNQSPRQISITAYIINNENKEIANGDYDVRFALYSIDRAAADAYPSNSDARLWEETQKVTLRNGILTAYLGSTVPLPATLNFGSAQYYLGVRIGQDSEMIPRKRIGAVPLAINALDAESLRGATLGTGAGNILQLGAGGKVNIKNLPTGTSGKKLLMAQDLPATDISISGDYDYISAGGTDLTLEQINLGTDVTGTLPVANGGTGLGTAPGNGKLLIGNGTGYSLANLSAGANVTITNGAGTIQIASTDTTYTAGTLLDLVANEFSVTSGTLTDGRLCTYTTADGLVCDTLSSSVGHIPVTINATANGLSVDGSQVLTLGLASTSTIGALSDTDWDIFNSKLSSATDSTQGGYFGDLYLYDDSTPSHYLQITNSGNLTAAHTLSLNTNDADRTVSLTGDLTLDNSLDLAGTTGQITLGTSTHTLAFTTTNNTALTLPTTGTLATTADKLSVFAATTSAELSGVLSDENTSGGYMTDVMTTAGDIIYAAASGVPARLAGSGTNAWVLKYNTGTSVPYWAAESGATYTAGNYLDLVGSEFSFDPSELKSVTWGDNSDADIVWTYDALSSNGTFGFYEDENAFALATSSFGIGVTAPASLLEVYSSTANPVLTITGAHATDFDPQIAFRTDASPTTKFALGVDSGDSDNFKIYSGTAIGDTSEFMISTTGVTSIANLEMGTMAFDTDAGAVSWADLPVVSATDNTIESYTAYLDGNAMLTIYGLSTGGGAVDNLGVGIGTTTPEALLDVLGTGTTTSVAYIHDTAVMTTTGNLLTLTAAAATTTTGLLTLNAAGLTTGYAQNINVNGAAVLQSGGAINIVGPTGTAAQAAGSLLKISTAGVVTGTDGSGNSLQISSATVAGTVASITDAGTMLTTGDLLTLTANAATTATGLLTMNATGLTTGYAQAITNGAVLTTGGALNFTGASYLHTGAETGSLVNIALTDASSNASGSAITNGILLSPTFNTTASAGAKTLNGLNISPTLTACGTTGGTCTLNDLLMSTPARTQSTTNTMNIYGVNLTSAGALVQNTVAGTINWVGANVQMPNITQTTGAVTSTGIKITGGTVTSGTSYALTTSASAGNVGIGITTPSAPLHVATTGYGHAAIFTTDGGTTSIDGRRIDFNGVSSIINSGSGNLTIGAASSTTQLVLDSGGSNVGIGATAPASLLEVYSSTANPVLTLTGAHATDYDPQIAFRTDASPTTKFALGVDSGDSDAFKIYSGTAIGDTSEFMISTAGVTSIANLEMGEMAFPADAGTVSWIDLPVTSAADNTVESYTASLDGNAMLTIYGWSAGASAVDHLGVGIGTLTPGYMLDVYKDVASDYAASFTNDGNNANRYGIRVQAGNDDGVTGLTYYLAAYDGDGGAVGYCQNSSGTWTCPDASDVRTKTNIVDTALNGLDIINNLRVADFNRIANPDGPIIHGFIAQEVQQVYPFAVSEGENGYLFLSRELMIPAIVKAMQEQNAIISSQGTELVGQGTVITALDSKTLSFDDKISLIGASLSQIDSQLTGLDVRVTGSETKIASLEAQMAEILKQYQMVTDLAAALDPDTLVYKTNGNVDLGVGKLEAGGIVAGAFTVKVVDPLARTIGSDAIHIYTDADGDGQDDSFPGNDGQSIEIKTKAVTETAKIFVTSKIATDQPLAVTKKKSGESFRVEVKSPVEENLAFDWWIVEENNPPAGGTVPDTTVPDTTISNTVIPNAAAAETLTQ